MKLPRFAGQVHARMADASFKLLHLLVRWSSSVRRGPVWRHERFPWLSQVEAEHGAILAELEAYLAAGAPVLGHMQVSADAGVRFGTAPWSFVHLKVFDRELPGVARSFPRTMKMAEAIPDACSVFFSCLPAERKRIPRHRDTRNGTLRLHLGLSMPSTGACYMMVGDQVCHWRRGEAFVFDATEEHEVLKEADEARVVLIVDFVRPMPRWLRVLSYERFAKRVNLKHIRGVYADAGLPT
jgi:aspartyl/asparaginyl beta-hydroxylase (cupin superfamily)